VQNKKKAERRRQAKNLRRARAAQEVIFRQLQEQMAKEADERTLEARTKFVALPLSSVEETKKVSVSVSVYRKPGAAGADERSNNFDMQAIADLFVAAPDMSAKQMMAQLRRAGHPSVKEKTCNNVKIFGRLALDANERLQQMKATLKK
jgi:hypothetical protein